MASKSLGQLTLDIIAKISGFTAPLDKASRHTKKTMRDIKKSSDDLGSSLRSAFGALAIGAAFGAIIKNSIESEKAIASLESTLRATGRYTPELSKQMLDFSASLQKVSTFSDEAITASQELLLGFGLSGQTFIAAQKAVLDLAAGLGKDLPDAARTVGLALADPIKGIRLLRGLNVVLSASQADLIKNFVKTGKAAEAQGVIIDALNDKFGGKAAAALNTFGGALTALKESFGNLLEGSGGNLTEATAAVQNLTATTNDPAVKAGFDTLTAGVLGFAGAAASAIAVAGPLAKFIAESVAALKTGAHIDDPVRLNQQLSDAIDKRAALLKKINQPRDNLLESLLIRSATPAWQKQLDDLNAEIERAQGLIKLATPVAAAAAKAPDLPNVPAVKAIAQAVTGLTSNQDKARDAAQKLTDGIQKQVDALSLNAKTIGMTSDEAKLYELSLAGATGAQLEQARQALGVVAAFERQNLAMEEQKQVQEDYKSLLGDLQTEEEALTQKMRERLAVLDAIANISDKTRDAVTQKIIDQGFSKAPDFSGIAPEVGGASGELGKIEKARQELEAWYSQQLAMLNTNRQQMADLGAQWDQKELDLKAQHDAKLAELDAARQEVALESFNQFFESLENGFADSVGKAIVFSEDLGEALNSVAQQALAGLISALVKLGIQWATTAVLGESLAASALAATTATSAAAGVATATAWAPAAALVNAATFGGGAAAGATGLAAIAALSETIALSGMAHDGIDKIPADGSWLLQKGERVTTANTSAKLDNTLSEIQRGGSGVVVNIANYGTSKQFDVQKIGPDEVRIIARDEARAAVNTHTPGIVSREMNNPNSTVSKSLSRSTLTQRRR